MRSRNCHFQSGEGGVRHPGAGVLMTAWFPRHTLTNGFQTLLECFAPFLQDPQVHTVYVIGSEARAGSPGAAAPPSDLPGGNHPSRAAGPAPARP